MRFERIARALYCDPWAIRPEFFAVMHEVFQRHLDGTLDLSPDAATVNVFGMNVEIQLPQEYEIADGIAIIEVHGVLDKRMSSFEKACIGGVDYDDISEAIELANDDKKVTGIVLNIDSPGGAVRGLYETAHDVMMSEKPIVAYTDGCAASAGYYLAAGADGIVCSHSGEVGSIGTLISFLDVSAAYEMQGVKREMISSGKYKGMGFPGLALTEEQREFLQDSVNKHAQEFKTWVTDHRGDVPDTAMQGQMHRSIEAQELGLIDTLGNINDAVILAQDLAAQNRGE